MATAVAASPPTARAEKMAKVGVRFNPADNSRITGWTQVRDRLEGEDGNPMLYVFSTCQHLIRTLPALQHDSHRPEDVDTDGEDHAGDEWRYGCMSRPWIRKPKVDPRKPSDAYSRMTAPHAETWRA